MQKFGAIKHEDNSRSWENTAKSVSCIRLWEGKYITNKRSVWPRSPRFFIAQNPFNRQFEMSNYMDDIF